MKTTQTQKHLGQSVGLGIVFIGTSIGIVALMILQSGAWQ